MLACHQHADALPAARGEDGAWEQGQSEQATKQAAQRRMSWSPPRSLARCFPLRPRASPAPFRLLRAQHECGTVQSAPSRQLTITFGSGGGRGAVVQYSEKGGRAAA